MNFLRRLFEKPPLERSTFTSVTEGTFHRLPLEEAERIINAYGAVLMTPLPADYCALLRPQSNLPYSREQIRNAIVTVLAVAPPSMVDSLTVGYMKLGEFVPDADAAVADIVTAARPRLRLGEATPDDLQAFQRLSDLVSESNAECARLLAEVQDFLGRAER